MDRNQEIQERLRALYSGKVTGKHNAKRMYTLRVLILEDDLQVLSLLTDRLSILERESIHFDIAITVLSESTQVAEYINTTEADFDVILLDRDCKSCGSFHILDFEKFGVDKIISISAIPEWNEEARQRGVTKVVLKDHSHLEEFADQVIKVIQESILK